MAENFFGSPEQQALYESLMNMALTIGASCPQQSQLVTQLGELLGQAEMLQAVTKLQDELMEGLLPQREPNPHLAGQAAAAGGSQAAGQQGKNAHGGPSTRSLSAAEQAAAAARGEELLSASFGVTDTLNPDESRAFALMANCTEEHVRATFGRMRGAVRTALTRMHVRRAAEPNGANGEAAAMGDVTAADDTPPPASLSAADLAARAAAYQQKLTLEEARQYEQVHAMFLLQDPQTLGLSSSNPLYPAALVKSMKVATSWSVRGSQLRVVVSTPRSSQALVSFVASGAPALMSAWLTEAIEERQSTFVRATLTALHHLPVTRQLCIPELCATIQRLTKSRDERIARPAATLLRHWQPEIAAAARAAANTTRAVAGGAGPGELPASLAAAAHLAVPVRGQGQSGGGGGVAGAQNAAKRVGAGHYSSRPLTADEITRAKKKDRQRQEMAATYGAVGGSGAGAGTLPSQQQQQQQQVLQRPSNGPPTKRQATQAVIGRQGSGNGSATAAAAGAGGTRGGNGAGFVRLQPPAAAAAAVASAGDHDLADLDEDALEALRQHREQKQARAAAAALPAHLQHPEVAQAIQYYQRKTAESEGLRALRQQAEVDEERRSLHYRGALEPVVMWHLGPLLPEHHWSLRGTGEESTESTSMSLPRGPPPRHPGGQMATPHEPPWEHAVPVPAHVYAELYVRPPLPPGAPKPSARCTVPWVPVDRLEADGQNRFMWNNGVRLPGLVWPPQQEASPTPGPVPAPAPAQQHPSSYPRQHQPQQAGPAGYQSHQQHPSYPTAQHHAAAVPPASYGHVSHQHHHQQQPQQQGAAAYYQQQQQQQYHHHGQYYDHGG